MSPTAENHMLFKNHNLTLGDLGEQVTPVVGISKHRAQGYRHAKEKCPQGSLRVMQS